MEYLQKLEMVIMREKATLKAITTIFPNNFEFQLCLSLQIGDDLIEDPFDEKDSSGDEAWTDAVTLSLFLNFCLDCPFRFSIYQDEFFLFIVSNFCLDRPFGVSVHRDAHFCLSRPLRVFDLPSCSFLFLDKVFLDCISIHRTWEFITIHGCKSHGAAGKCSFDNIRAFVIRRPFAPRIWLKGQDLFKHEVAFLKFTRSNLFVESLFHPCLV